MMLGRRLLHQHGHARAAGKAQVVDAGVARQRVARLKAVAGDDVEGTGRKAGLGGQLGHAQQRQASVFGRLDNANIAGGQGGAHAAAKQPQGVVPGQDVAGYTVGLTPAHGAVALGAGQRVALQLVCSACIKRQAVSQCQRVGPGLAGGLAGFALHEL